MCIFNLNQNIKKRKIKEGIQCSISSLNLKLSSFQLKYFPWFVTNIFLEVYKVCLLLLFRLESRMLPGCLKYRICLVTVFFMLLLTTTLLFFLLRIYRIVCRQVAPSMSSLYHVQYFLCFIHTHCFLLNYYRLPYLCFGN